MPIEQLEGDLPPFDRHSFSPKRNYPDEFPLHLARFLEAKEIRMWKIFSDPKVREKIINWFFNLADEEKPEHADFALVLGTSPTKYPDKFKKRVHWASMLWHKKLVDRIVFTGRGDDETNDVSQSEDAKDMAVIQFKVPANAILVAGGDNTQENILRAKEFIPFEASVFLVSDNSHLIRGVSVARYMLGASVRIFPHPVGGLQRLNPHYYGTIIELIKAEGYNHTSYRVNPGILRDQSEFISRKIKETIKRYEQFLRRVLSSSQGVEEQFSDWVDRLPTEYRLPKII